MIFQVVLLVLLGSTLRPCKTAAAINGTDPSHGGWKQISNFQVCVEPRDNGHGIMHYYGEDKLVGALKLKWKMGTVRCTSNEVSNSRWGCAEKTYPLNIIITDETDLVIFPLPQYIKDPHGLWYQMPLVDAVYSDELVFTNFCQPFYLKKDASLRFWYGEDLKNRHETDNQGRVCFDVLARFM